MKKILIALLVLVQAQAYAGDTISIKKHLVEIVEKIGSRSHDSLGNLNRAADYIEGVFRKYSDSVTLQEYKVKTSGYRNIICSFGTENKKRIVIGAHYDVCGYRPGADDNASGVVGLLELARMLKGQKLKYRVDLVAYSLEEPPYFETQYMGSNVHAEWLKQQNAAIYGMISLEMIGFFKDEKGSQKYPLKMLSVFYGKRGNYITLVKKFGAGKFARKFSRKYKRRATVRTKRFTGPAAIPGIDFSDHANYWDEGYSALMITDTSFYRNPNYHKVTDTIDTLDLKRMGLVIDSVFATLTAL